MNQKFKTEKHHYRRRRRGRRIPLVGDVGERRSLRSLPRRHDGRISFGQRRRRRGGKRRATILRRHFECVCIQREMIFLRFLLAH